MASAPRIGSTVTIKGHGRARRLPSNIGIEAFDPSHVALGFPRVLDDTGPNEIQADYPHVDKDGYCAFASKREINEFSAKHPRYRYDA